MRRYYVEDEDGNRGYLSNCQGWCEQGRRDCRTPEECRDKPTTVQHLIIWALTASLIVWLCWQVACALVDWVRS